jgi:hypothetical protein
MCNRYVINLKKALQLFEGLIIYSKNTITNQEV